MAIKHESSANHDREHALAEAFCAIQLPFADFRGLYAGMLRPSDMANYELGTPKPDPKDPNRHRVLVGVAAQIERVLFDHVNNRWDAGDKG